MRAARVHAFGSAPSYDVDVAPPQGEVLVRMAAAALGHLDRSVASGSFLAAPSPPYVPGVEGAGWRVSDGAPVWLRGGGLGVGRDGTCAELVAAPAGAVHAAPADVDLALAAGFFSPATSAQVAVHDLGGLVPGERVAVTGAAGAVGSLAVQLALLGGAVAVDALSSRPDLVPPGATPVGELPEASVDLLVDTVGGPALPGRLAAVVPGGRAVLVGYTAGTSVTLDLPTLMQRDVRLLPLNMLRRAPSAFGVADDLLRRLSRGDLTLPVHRFPLADVPEAWRVLGAGAARGRVVLEL